MKFIEVGFVKDSCETVFYTEQSHFALELTGAVGGCMHKT